MINSIYSHRPHLERQVHAIHKLAEALSCSSSHNFLAPLRSFQLPWISVPSLAYHVNSYQALNSRLQALRYMPSISTLSKFSAKLNL